MARIETTGVAGELLDIQEMRGDAMWRVCDSNGDTFDFGPDEIHELAVLATAISEELRERDDAK